MTGETLKTALDGLTGKTASTENFPVGSRLIPAHLRPTVAAYYRFARLCDDIADDPALPSAEKMGRLDALDRGLADGVAETDEAGIAVALREELARAGVPLVHARDLLTAFKRDARNEGCADWAALMDYCRYSAMPVGRFLLVLHGEDEATFAAGDALCAAHQVLNHIQDVKRDYLGLGRVYVPADALDAAGLSVETLADEAASPALRGVLNGLLDRCDDLIRRAKPLVGQVADRGLRMETAAIVTLAERLSAKLRGTDPLARRVELGTADWAAAGTRALLAAWRSA